MNSPSYSLIFPQHCFPYNSTTTYPIRTYSISIERHFQALSNALLITRFRPLFAALQRNLCAGTPLFGWLRVYWLLLRVLDTAEDLFEHCCCSEYVLHLLSFFLLPIFLASFVSPTPLGLSLCISCGVQWIDRQGKYTIKLQSC